MVSSKTSFSGSFAISLNVLAQLKQPLQPTLINSVGLLPLVSQAQDVTIRATVCSQRMQGNNSEEHCFIEASGFCGITLVVFVGFFGGGRVRS